MTNPENHLVNDRAPKLIVATSMGKERPTFLWKKVKMLMSYRMMGDLPLPYCQRRTFELNDFLLL
jgi:hypothetical protein